MGRNNVSVFVLTALFVVIGIYAFMYYKYQFVYETTEYFGIRYIPSVLRGISFFGRAEYSKAKVVFEQLPSFASDSLVIIQNSQKIKSKLVSYQKRLEKINHKSHG